jgi:hypothetical protein
VGREDGFATREDLGTDIGTDRFGEHLASVPLSILSHVCRQRLLREFEEMVGVKPDV